MRFRPVVLGVALAAGLGLTGATPAAADQFDCTFYLLTQGYGGTIVDIGCDFGAQGNQVICTGSLRIAGVPDGIAGEACRRAEL
jgi:hypothetical protein